MSAKTPIRRRSKSSLPSDLGHSADRAATSLLVVLFELSSYSIYRLTQGKPDAVPQTQVRASTFEMKRWRMPHVQLALDRGIRPFPVRGFAQPPVCSPHPSVCFQHKVH